MKATVGLSRSNFRQLDTEFTCAEFTDGFHFLVVTSRGRGPIWEQRAPARKQRRRGTGPHFLHIGKRLTCVGAGLDHQLLAGIPPQESPYTCKQERKDWRFPLMSALNDKWRRQCNWFRWDICQYCSIEHSEATVVKYNGMSEKHHFCSCLCSYSYTFIYTVILTFH